MSITRRGLVGAGVPMFLAGAAGADAQDPASRLAMLATGKGEVRRLEDFGARGDFNPATRRGTDDTLAIQTAIEWAYDSGRHSPGRAILVESRNYLCGPITTYPYTTIIGTGRQTSAFWCRPGTRGAWWSDRGRGAQKLMLSGLAWYGGDEPGLTAVARFGRDGVVFGTEGILQGLWLRGAPRATALDVLGNVGILRDITVQDCDTGILVGGNGNQVENVFSMQNRVGARFYGSFVRGLHVEAVSDGGLPLFIAGDCRVSDGMFSLAANTAFDHLIEVDISRYREWSLSGIQIFARNARLRRALLKLGGADSGGRGLDHPGGLDIRPSMQLHSGSLVLGHQRWRCFAIELTRERSALTCRVLAAANGALDEANAAFLGTARASLLSGADPTADFQLLGGRLIFATPAIALEGFALDAAVRRNTTGRGLTVEAGIAADRGNRLQIAVYDAASGEPWDPQSLTDGQILRIGVSGFGG